MTAMTAMTAPSKKTNSLLGAAFEMKMPENARPGLSLVWRLVLLAAAAVAVLLVLLCSPLPAMAEPSGPAPTPPMAPMSPALEARLKQLETELRCLVCQNQTLAESPSGLAGDLRREVRLLAESGKSDEEIKTHLRARYGDFVLYRPPLELKTYLLWFGPFALLLGGGGLLWWLGRSRRRLSAGAPAQTLSTDEAKRVRDLLGD